MRSQAMFTNSFCICSVNQVQGFQLVEPFAAQIALIVFQFRGQLLLVFCVSAANLLRDTATPTSRGLLATGLNKLPATIDIMLALIR